MNRNNERRKLSLNENDVIVRCVRGFVIVNSCRNCFWALVHVYATLKPAPLVTNGKRSHSAVMYNLANFYYRRVTVCQLAVFCA